MNLLPARKIFFFLLLAVACTSCFAQKVYQDQQIRFALWAARDAYPGYFDNNKEGDTKEKAAEAGESLYTVPVQRIKEVTPYLLEGMIYGWKFDYTPYDKARRVEEYFEFSPVQTLTESDKSQIVYTKPWVQDDRLWCWVEFRRSPQMMHIFNSWQVITNPHIKGIGYARLADGFEGIKEACGEALKNAVREYERKLIKNKPKEITGRVMITEPPLIGIDAGRYVVTLDFFLETDRIVKYETF